MHEQLAQKVEFQQLWQDVRDANDRGDSHATPIEVESFALSVVSNPYSSKSDKPVTGEKPGARESKDIAAPSSKPKHSFYYVVVDDTDSGDYQLDVLIFEPRARSARQASKGP